MLRLEGYVRVSRVGGRAGEGYISPSEQRRQIESYASDLGGEIVEWSTDEDYTGGNTQRPGFEAMLERLELGAADGVVVMAVDRFARSTADGTRVVREIVDRGQVFASCHERMDPRTPEGHYMLVAFLNNAELFLNKSKAAWKVSKARAITRGAHIGPTPIGYSRIPKHEERSGVLVPDRVFGPVLSDLFDRAAAGRDGDTALARWMVGTVERPKGGRPWQPSEIRRWLSNRVYLGEVRYGELVNAEAHEPLTDEVTWRRCQREPRERRVPHSRFLLTGLVRCAGCRYAMGGLTHGGRDGRYPVYRCANARSCPAAAVITRDRLDSYVTELAELGRRAEGSGRTIDLVAVDAAEAEATRELNDFAADLEQRRILGEEAYGLGLRARAADRDAKVAASTAAHAEVNRLSADRDLHELAAHDLRSYLLGAVRHIFVARSPRRGAEVRERVVVVFADDDRAIDVPGPHRSGPFEPVNVIADDAP